MHVRILTEFFLKQQSIRLIHFFHMLERLYDAQNRLHFIHYISFMLMQSARGRSGLSQLSFDPRLIETSVAKNARRVKNINVLVGLRPRVIGSIREGCNMAIHSYVRDTPSP